VSTSAQLVDAFVRLADAARLNRATDVPSDDELARVVTAAIKLYAARVEQTGQYPQLVENSATATETIVAVTEMMRFADLNAFDVNMWLSRRG
jgi:hypothetical protein